MWPTSHSVGTYANNKATTIVTRIGRFAANSLFIFPTQLNRRSLHVFTCFKICQVPVCSLLNRCIEVTMPSNNE